MLDRLYIIAKALIAGETELAYEFYNCDHQDLVRSFALKNNLKAVEFLLNNGYEIADDIVSTAVKVSNFETVKSLVNNSVKVTESAVVAAALKNSTETIEFLVENGGPASDVALLWAIYNYNINAIKILVKHGATQDDSGIFYATSAMFSSVYTYASENKELIKSIIKNGIQERTQVENDDAVTTDVITHDVNDNVQLAGLDNMPGNNEIGLFA